MAEALYRKYRPQTFEDVVGQEPIERTLRNALEQNKISHAYLFCGPRGTGKTTTARLLAKALLCQNGPTPQPDGTCEDCRMIADGTHPDVYELDAASRTGVENMREEVIGRVQFAPTRGRTKVYIIDEVHMLSLAAFNALLKTLEEPPDHVVFILCTTDPQKVPETVHSRCQRFDFRRIAPESMVARLGAVCVAEGVQFEGEALDLIAHRADGGLRNALTSLEQIIAFEGGTVTLAGAERLLGSIDSSDMAEIMAYIGKRDIANCLRWTAEYIETGSDLAQFVRDMAEHVRDLYVMAVAGEDVELDVSETMRRQLASELQWFGPDRLARFMGVLGDLMSELKTSSNPRLSFEIALTRLVRPDSDLTIEALAERIEALESGYSAVAHVLPGEPVFAAPAASVNAGPVAPAAALQPAYAPAQQVGKAPEREGASAEAPAVAAAATMAAAPAAAAVAGDRQAGRFEQAPAQQQAAAPAAQQVAAQRPMQQTQPSAAAPVASGASGSPLANPATLQRTWQAAMALVKKHKMAYGALFMNTRITYNAQAGAVEIEFPAESNFAFNAVQKPEARDALASAWERAFGSPIQFTYRLGGAAASAPAAVAAPAPEYAPASAPAPAPAPMPSAEPASAPAPMPAAAPAPEPASAPMPSAEPAPAPASAPMPAAEPAPAPMPAYDDEPPYEPVPYEEFGYDESAYDEAPLPAPKAEPTPAQPGAEASVGELEALLKAGFGDNIRFEEVESE